MVEHRMQLIDWLDDLCVRFIINLPREELESVERICFQVEEAHWYYEDFIRPLDQSLPSLNLRDFCMKIFQHCPLFVGYDQDVFKAAYANFLVYKGQVPVRGAIMLNEAMDAAVLVKGWKKGASWSFPRGKINKDEEDLDCAIREVYEETGYDVKVAGLVNPDDAKFIEVTMRDQNLKLLVVPGVPMDTHFEPRTRKEISKISWYKLSDLPTMKKKTVANEGQDLVTNTSKFYMVAPFMGPLNRHITHLKKRKKHNARTQQAVPSVLPEVQVDAIVHPEVDESPLNDMTRLMAQLRQSQQASRENNLPEVTKVETVSDANAALFNKIIGEHPGSSPPHHIRDFPASRERKAQAMLQLLHGPATQIKKESAELPPETPFDQITSNPLEPPPSPKHYPLRTGRIATNPPAPTAPFFTAQGYPPAFGPIRVDQPQIPGPMLQTPQPNRTVSQPFANGGINGRDHQYASPSSPGKRDIGGPAADKLPLPKLNAHSSNLLNLFKQGPSTPKIAQLATQSPRPELSASRSVGNQQVPFQRPLITDNIRASHALAPSPLGSSRSGQKTPGQQETLLNLFKSNFPGKPSPSLASPPAPAELSANPVSAHVDARDDSNSHETRASVRNISPLTEDERPFKLPFGGPELSPDLSATVTGPLGEMHFDTLRSPEPRRKSNLAQSPKHLSPKGARRGSHKPASQQQIRILPRPESSHATTTSAKQEPVSSPRPKRQKQEAEPPAMKPAFQPQILKRPIDPPQPENSPPSAPQVFPQQILARPSTAERSEPFKAVADSQKAALLALFNAKKVDKPPIMSASALPISPLSERPAPDSALPSPLGSMSRSRLASTQSTTGGFGGILPSGSGSVTANGASTPKATTQGILPGFTPSTAARSGPSSVASPVDRNFLLGFLDDVANKGAR